MSERPEADTDACGSACRAGGRPSSPTGPTSSTPSRSSRWRAPHRRRRPGPRPRVRRGPGRPAGGGRRRRRGSASTPRPPRSPRPGAGAAGVAYVRGRATSLPFVAGSVRRRGGCLVLEHVDGPRRRPRRGGPRAAPRRSVRPVPQPPAVPDARQRLDRRPGPRPARAVLAGRPLPDRGRAVEEVDAGVRLPFFHRPLSRYVNAMADRGLFLTRMDEPAPPAGFLALAAGVRGRGDHPALAVPARRTAIGRGLASGWAGCRPAGRRSADHAVAEVGDVRRTA